MMTIQLSRDSYLVIYQGFMCFVAVKLPRIQGVSV